MASRHWVTSRDYDSEDAGRHWLGLSENARGALLWVSAAAALIGIAFGIMMLLTSPDGWATKIAQTATSGEEASLAVYDISSAE